jgi:DNA polymerase I
MRSVSPEKLRDYSCEDADLTFQLKQKIDPDLDKSGVRELFETLEMPLVPVLVHMENAGVKINSEELNEYAKVLLQQIIQIEKR